MAGPGEIAVSPRESPRARQAWADYLALGPDRSLEKLLDRYRSVPSAPTTRLPTLKGWSRNLGWQARLAAIADRAAQEAEAKETRTILSRCWYMWQTEPCIFGWIRGNKPARLSNDFLSNVWSIPTIRPGTETEHPTSKPLEVFAIPMRQHTKPGDICYEPFSGSGSQIMAGEQLGRRVFALELEPGYVDVAVRRWEKLTGQVAALEELTP